MHHRPLRVLLLADDKPGHYHQAEGVVAALKRLRPVDLQRLNLRRRFRFPGRVLRHLVNRGVAPQLILKLGYGIAAGDLSPADIVVSAGGETLAANAAAARLLGASNVFCGTLRRLAPEHIRVVVVSQEQVASSHPNYLLGLPPSPFETPQGDPVAIGADTTPSRIGLLVGGNSGTVAYTDRDWEILLAFLSQMHRQHGTRWLVTTSRRSPVAVAEALTGLARQENGPVERFLDYRVAGPGSLNEILADAQAIVVTADSTAMITQAICARRPVVAVASETRRMEERELEYRAYLTRMGWLRALPFSKLAPDAFLRALREVTPRKTGALEDLAAALAQRLPELLGVRPEPDRTPAPR